MWVSQGMDYLAIRIQEARNYKNPKHWYSWCVSGIGTIDRSVDLSIYLSTDIYLIIYWYLFTYPLISILMLKWQFLIFFIWKTTRNLSIYWYLSIYLYIYLSIYLSIYISFYLSIFLSFYLSIYLGTMTSWRERAGRESSAARWPARPAGSPSSSCTQGGSQLV